MKKRLLLIALFMGAVALLTGLRTECRGEVVLDIAREAVPRIDIGLVLPEALEEFNEVLKQDLYWSGFFRPRAIARPESADWTVFLAADEEGNGVAVRLYSGGPGALVFNRLFTVTPRNERRLAHAVARDVIETLTGEPAITLTRIVAARQTGEDDRKEIVLLDYDGERPRLVTRDTTLNRHPRFSPDGESLLYTSFIHYWPAVFRHRISTGQRERVAYFPGLNTAAVFHPKDDNTIALTLSKDGSPGEIYLLNLESGEPTRLTRSASSDTSPVFFPAGSRLAFVSDRTGLPQIYRLDIESGAVRRLTFHGQYSTSPTISPDGRFLAYTSRVDGRFEIRLLVLETGQDLVLTSGPGNKEDPAFAVNSRHLVFVHAHQNSRNLKLLDIFTRETYAITDDGGYSTPDWR